jgi:hypothetical protein
MDTGLSIRPITSVAQTGVARPEPVPVRDAVATDLAPSQSVTAAVDSTAARNDPAQNNPDSPLSREIVIDAQSREVIFRVIDERSGRVVRQVPEEALLRLKAYVRSLTEDDRKGDVVEKTA